MRLGKTMKIKRKVVVNAIASIFVLPIAANAQSSLSETIRFIEENIYGKVKVSCERMDLHVNANFEESFSKMETKYSIPIREVEFFENVGGNLSLKCLSGKCLGIQFPPSENMRLTDLAIVKVRVSIPRVISAFQHLQKICGGAKPTPF